MVGMLVLCALVWENFGPRPVPSFMFVQHLAHYRLPSARNNNNCILVLMIFKATDQIHAMVGMQKSAYVLENMSHWFYSDDQVLSQRMP